MEFNEHWRNKYTSLKAAFRSTDPTKHFHGNSQKKFKPTIDYPDVSEPQLTSKSVDDNIPVKPKKFKERLLSSYNENDTSTRQFASGQTARYSDAGIKLYSKHTNKQIKKLDDKLSRKETGITGDDSQKHINALSKDTINRQHQLNALKPKTAGSTAAQFSHQNKLSASNAKTTPVSAAQFSHQNKSISSGTTVSAAQFSHQNKSVDTNKSTKTILHNYTQHQNFKNKLITHYHNKNSRK